MEHSLKERIFGRLQKEVISNQVNSESQEMFSLEEIMESLLYEPEKIAIFEPKEKKTKEELEDTDLLIDEKKGKKPDVLLYGLGNDTYVVYNRKETEEEKGYREREREHSYGLFVPSGVTVRRVPQGVLGNGVLGRAFIFQNYIEILDSLTGNAYQEVLTHEVLHILNPEKKEMEIRQMTRNYIGERNTVYH
ncbi:hypothetical protein JXC34_02825 [Candidatus Woesearchaeota archaeon]|nr:hypothetical protein [Candidatus Woesearchaeota archaeon]